MQKVLPMRSYYLSRTKEQTKYAFIKRTIDIALSAVSMILLLPVFLIVFVLASIDTKKPFFVQTRMGRNNQPFRILKFRTMSCHAPANMATCKLENAESYMSAIGRVLRKLSLDELPQLWNIFVGDMSFVGPRPVVLSETELLALRVKNGAACIRPGLTGWAQVNGRDHVNVLEKATLDGDYTEQISLEMDLRIMVKTVACVVSAKDIQEGAQTDQLEPEEVFEPVSSYRRNRSA